MIKGGGKFSVTKIVKFDAAHRLPGYDGACVNLHGHTWKVEVEVRLSDEQMYDPSKDEMLADFGEIKGVLKARFLDRIDHSYINSAIGEVNYPSAENITLWIKDRLINAFPNYLTLHRVRVWESETAYAEWRER